MVKTAVFVICCLYAFEKKTTATTKRGYSIGSGGFSKKSRGEGAEFAVLEEIRVFEKCFGLFVDYTCFSEEKMLKTIEAQAEVSS